MRMKITKSQLKQIIKEEISSDSALLGAIEKLATKIDGLDVSIDYLAASVTGEDAVSLGYAQDYLGRYARPPSERGGRPGLEEIVQEEVEEALTIGGETFTMEAPKEPAKEILKHLMERLSEVGDIDTISEEEAMDVLDVVIDGMQEIFHLGGFGTQSPVKEVSSEKQRRWACAQKDKPAASRKKSLSAAEAEEMCKSKVEAA